MARLATYECWCCGGRVVRRLDEGERARSRVACGGFCRPCGNGQCLADATRVATERVASSPLDGVPA